MTSLSSYKSLFSPLIKDLKKLESEGINVGIGKSVCVTVAYISGSNLGNHWLGGLVYNFLSSSHCCRYCHVSSSMSFSDPFSVGNIRTVTSYRGISYYSEQCVILSKMESDLIVGIII